jgi:hypothetical protein
MKNSLLFLLVIIVVIFTSCRTQRYVYSPSAQNIPYFKEKGDSKISVFYSEGDNGLSNTNQQLVVPEKKKNNGFDIQAAYALTNHWAVMFNYYQRRELDFYNHYANIFDTSYISYKRFIAEVGFGYFVPLNRRKTITYNIYTGIGLGKFSFIDTGYNINSARYSRYFDNKITKMFLQGGFNFMPSKYFSFSVSGRFSFVHYGANNSSYSATEQQYFYLDKISNNTLTFWEPTLSMQLGIRKLEWLKIEGSITSSTVLPNGYPAIRSLNASIGLTVDPLKIFKSKK